MDFTLDSQQQALAETVSRWCAREYDSVARTRRLRDGPDAGAAIWRSMAEMGWHGAGLAESDGGFGGGIVENVILMEAFGRALVLEPFLSSTVLALQTLAALPGSGIRDELLARGVAGETVLALAHAEPGSSSAPDGIRTVAEASAGGWRLKGEKSCVPGAPAAAQILVPARTSEGIGIFLVETADIAEMAHPYRLIDNQPAADIRLESAPAKPVELDPVRASLAIEEALAHALIAQCGEAVGAMDAAISATADYVRTRRQFGQTLNGFQAVQHRMADMLVEAELSRSILYGGMAALTSRGAERARTLSAMKAVVASAALFVGRQAVQLHGGMGVTEDCFVSHLYRRLFVIAGQFGNESFHLARMAGIAPETRHAPLTGFTA